MVGNSLLKENSTLFQLVLYEELYPKSYINIGYVTANRERIFRNNSFTGLVTQENYDDVVRRQTFSVDGFEGTSRTNTIEEASWRVFLDYSRRQRQNQTLHITGDKFFYETIDDARMLCNLGRFKELKDWVNDQPDSWSRKFYMATKVYSVVNPTVTTMTGSGKDKTSQVNLPAGSVATAVVTGGLSAVVDGLGDAHIKVRKEGEQSMKFDKKKTIESAEGSTPQGPTQEGNVFAVEWAEIYSSSLWGLSGGFRNDETQPERDDIITLDREGGALIEPEVKEYDGTVIDLPGFPEFVFIPRRED